MRSLHCAAYIAVKVIALGGLKSSAFRTCQDYLCESLHIREMMKSEPGAFEGLDPFETLVFAQHYGVPTRLLDVAYNPLVAFFLLVNRLSIRKTNLQMVLYFRSALFRYSTDMILAS